jgi:multidrug efflux pump subunit AcrA (membrane-fusion protein)
VVRTVAVESSPGRFTIEIEGVAVPFRQVTHAAEVVGRIVEKAPECRGGHFVQQHTVLLQIDPTTYALERDRLQAQLDQADRSLAEIETDLTNVQALIKLAGENQELQQRDLERVTQLHARNAATDSRLDEARKLEWTTRNALQTLQNQRQTAEQRRKTLEAARTLVETQLQKARLDLEKTTVKAPLTGTVISDDVEVGEYVKAGDPLFRLNDADTMEVSCQLRVDELYWVWLEAGTFAPRAQSASLADEDTVEAQRTSFELPQVPVEVVFPFEGVEYLWDGVLSRYEGAGLDAISRTVPCRVRIDHPRQVRVGGDGRAGPVAPPTLFSGMYVTVRIPIKAPIPLLRVPLVGLRPGGEVWVVREGKLVIVPAQLARIDGESALLRGGTTGLQAGDRVVVSPLAAFQSGMEVTPAE